jgi:hypothetical protein
MQPLPSYIDPEAWADYEAMRKRIKKPMTQRVIRQKLAGRSSDEARKALQIARSGLRRVA